MPKKKKIEIHSTASVAEVFENFLQSKRAQGLTEKTLSSYKAHFSAISKHLDTNRMIDDIQTSDLEKMISSMRDAELSSHSIRSYSSVLKAFYSWCQERGIASLYVPLYKAEETVKETYSDQELEILLKKPNLRKCKFSEYRNWVIINLLLNNGCRAATIRNIKIKDLDFDNNVIYLRHTKNKKAQVIPLCDVLITTLREYLRVRGGGPEDYLFPNEYGEQLTENGLRCSIAKYNLRRGVPKTSIHMFRHTFAKKYLVDCGGNAFTLQHLLGHSTLDMTKHYCAIFDADITKNYDRFSPLAQIQSKGKKICTVFCLLYLSLGRSW